MNFFYKSPVRANRCCAVGHAPVHRFARVRTVVSIPNVNHTRRKMRTVKVTENTGPVCSSEVEAQADQTD